MDDTIDYELSGPSFHCTFSPVDQVTPPIYSRRVLIFSRHENNHEEAVLALRSGLQNTINEFPILAGQMGHATTGWTIKNGVARLRVKTIDMDFAELQACNFCESMLPADLVSSVPTLADPQSEWHACRIQANFIRGGLLLVISIHHTTMDGYGITKVIESLARHCRMQGSKETSTIVDVDRAALFSSRSKGAIEKLGAYGIVEGPIKLGATPPSIVTTTCKLPPSALKELKAAASPAEGWITTHDAVNALFWRTHAASRRHANMVQDHDVARFAFPVEFRQLVRPKLSSDYIGNAVLMTKVDLPMETLLGQDGLRAAAVAIRAGVKQVDEIYVDNFIAVAKQLENPGQMKINLKLEYKETAFGSTSYKGFVHSTLDWGPVLGKYERLRLTSGVIGDGMSIVLPVLHDGSWEVTVSVEEDLLTSFKTNECLMQYTE